MKQVLQLIGGLAATISVYSALNGSIPYEILFILVLTVLALQAEEKEKIQEPGKSVIIQHYENIVVEK
ncbi:MAG: hypothetical protein Q7S92_01765 [Candidatus Diapherotrites archaeon]|nr:hypothetical protein [Candidatus Diapherotrites archaeon]